MAKSPEDSKDIMEKTKNKNFTLKERILGSKKKPEFEDILRKVGEFGRYQLRIFSILTIMDFATGQCMLYFVFANANPGWFCDWSDNEGNSTNTSSISALSYSSKGRCTGANGTQCPNIKFSGKFSSIVSEWGLVCELSYVPKLAVSIQMFGVLLGALATGQVADLFGRKKTLVTVATGMMTIQALVALSNSWQIYIFIRFLACVCLGGTMCLNSTIPMEFIGPKWRTVCGSLSLFVFGLALQCLWAYVFKDWRYQAVASGLATTPLILCIVIWVPESVRWLIQNERFEEAEVIVRKMAATNGREAPDLTILKSIAARNIEERKQRNKFSYFDLFRGKSIAIRTFVLLFTWFTCSTVFYGISTNYGSLSGNFYINTLISPMISLPFAWTVILTGIKFGRRWSFVGYMTVPCICMSTVFILICTDNDKQIPDLMRGLVLVGKGAVNACWMLAAIYSSELYPTLMRNLSMGACSTFARIAGMVTPQITYLGSIHHRSIPYAVYTILAISCALLVFVFLPETKGKPLPEVIDVRPSSQDEPTNKEDEDELV